MYGARNNNDGTANKKAINQLLSQIEVKSFTNPIFTANNVKVM